MTTPRPTSRFAETRWTLVRRSQGDSTAAKSALSELCAAYYAPVLAFIRRMGRDEDSARDVAHDFFAEVLAANSLRLADPDRGRFRSYLLGAVKHFLWDAGDRERAEKRGGGAVSVPFDAATITSPGIEIADPHTAAPDLAFDRQWALTVLARALAAVEDAFATAGKSPHFDALKPWLTGDGGSLSESGVADRLGLSEGAVKVAVHRLRQKFRAAVRAEIAQTVETEAEVQEELTYLLSVVG